MNNIYQEYLKLQKIIKDTIKYIEENEYTIKFGENSATYDTKETRPLVESEKVLKMLRGKNE